MTAADRLAQIRARVEAATAPLPNDARMSAYYYGFSRTGVGSVDAILSAVAVAGKAYHGTAYWGDEEGSGYFRGRPGLPDAESAAGLIQATASQAAARACSVASDLSALLAAVEAVRALCDSADRGPKSSPWVHINDVWDAIEGALS